MTQGRVREVSDLILRGTEAKGGNPREEPGFRNRKLQGIL